MLKQLGTFAILAVCLFALLCASICPPVAADIWTSGKVVYTTNAGGDLDIAAMGPNGGHVDVLTSSTDHEFNPTWSPDGSEVLYVRDQFGNLSVWLMDADGSNQRSVFGSTSEEPSWAPDGDRFVVRSIYLNALLIVELNDERDDYSDFDSIVDSGNPAYPAWSPDGRYIAYVAGAPDYPSSGGSLYVYDVAAERSTKIVSGTPGRNMSFPTWGPQSYGIVFAWESAQFGDGNRGIFAVKRDGSSLTPIVSVDGSYLYHPTVAPYGGEVIVTNVNPDTRDRVLGKLTIQTTNAQEIGLSNATYNDDADWWHPSSFSVEPGASKLTTTWGSLKKKAK